MDIKGLEHQIDKTSSISQSALRKYLVMHKIDILNKKCTCEYNIIKNNGKIICEKGFLDYVYSYIIQYALKYNQYNQNEITAEIHNEAKEMFNTSKSSGDLGELILFILLESRGIVQLYSKIRRKTARNTNVHGYDGAHIEIKNGEIILHFGEAKIYQNFNDAVTNAINSIIDMKSEQKKLEFRMIRDDIDESKFDSFTEELMTYVNPYINNPTPKKISHPIFIGYEWNTIQILEQSSQLLQQILPKYDEDIIKKSKIIKEKIKSDIQMDFFIIPFKNVENFRKEFNKMLK